MPRSALFVAAVCVVSACSSCSSNDGPAHDSGGRDADGGGGADGSANGGGGADGSADTGGTSDWDWTGVIGTGQSLSVGSTPITSTTQPFHNLKLSLGSTKVPGNGASPWDPTVGGLSMIPLVEPIRPLATGFPGAYPGNLYGETPHTAMADQITSLIRAASPSSDYVTVHTVVGESGQSIVALNKQTGSTTGTTGRAYAATLFEAAAIARLAQAAGKTYGIGAIVMTHGESDAGSSTYKDELVQLLADYNADLAAITGQRRAIPMYLSQQHAFPNGAGSVGWRPIANQVEWQLGVDHEGDFVCTGPKYQYPAASNNDGVHLSALGYQMLGEKVGQVFYERSILGRDWQPLHPTSVERNGRVVAVHFQAPVPPLDWDTSIDAPAINAWAKGRGFELRTGDSLIAIDSVTISGDAVEITASSDLPASGLVVGYALSSQGVQMSTASKAVRWGQLRDSDPFVGSTTWKANPNYCVSFEMPVP